MPIYKPEEYPSVIERIKTKIAQKNISMGPTISETEIAAFESACNTRLPQAYRLFLLEVGDGWNDPAAEGIASPIHRLAEIEHKDLSLPMTLTDGWVWEDEEDEEQLSDESFERKLGNQGVELMDEGCGMTYELITAGRAPVRCGASRMWALAPAVSARTSWAGLSSGWIATATLTISRIMSTKKTNSICRKVSLGPA